ncbi:kinase-like domain-containing protein [Crucibulum laeve]|uniref:Kinase-like domain-containing protein n=1 Tax=Crucibulum laeve TaxID=68775 RepID=A0A5C3M3K5_9AGAR|nr:kinase-like domain-containing protein [Crucibulum laeve]
MKEGRLYPRETFWRDHQPWLKENGYLLRPRYQPDWVASWIKDPTTKRIFCEDGHVAPWEHILDAIRISDGVQVMLKRIELAKSPKEVEIGRMFSSPPLVSDPRNHCAGTWDVLKIPDKNDEFIIVMPLLQEFENPPFETVGEVVDLCRQLFEGLQFMHSNNVAHRDCKCNNIMMDGAPLYSQPVHPLLPGTRRDWAGTVKPSTRTRIPVKYYFVDFGLSRKYDDGVVRLQRPPWGGDRTVPEFAKGDPCNPFPVDVYCLGNVIRSYFLEGDHIHPATRSFSFIKELIDDMVQDDPKARPNMDEVVNRFAIIHRNLSTWTLRSRIVNADESRITGIFRSFSHWTKQIAFITKGAPPLPSSSRR